MESDILPCKTGVSCVGLLAVVLDCHVGHRGSCPVSNYVIFYFKNILFSGISKMILAFSHSLVKFRLRNYTVRFRQQNGWV